MHYTSNTYVYDYDLRQQEVTLNDKKYISFFSLSERRNLSTKFLKIQLAEKER